MSVHDIMTACEQLTYSTGEQRTLYPHINAHLLNTYISTAAESCGSILNILLIYLYTKRVRPSKFETCK